MAIGCWKPIANVIKSKFHNKIVDREHRNLFVIATLTLTHNSMSVLSAATPTSNVILYDVGDSNEVLGAVAR